MPRAIVKIDLVSSKAYFDKAVLSDPSARPATLEFLYERVRESYPYSDKNFPDGTLYDTQGDCAYLIMEKPTVALRATIEFMRSWFSAKESLPDCRAVIDYGDVFEVKVNDRVDASSDAFEDISQIEKEYGAGDIAVTERLRKHVDPTLVQFGARHQHWITGQRQVTTYVARYDDPRLIQDSSLVQALFVSSHTAEQARLKALEAILVEAITAIQKASMGIEQLNKWLADHGYPTMARETLTEVVSQSDLVKIGPDQQIRIDESATSRIESVREEFREDRETTVGGVASKIASELGVDVIELRDKLSLMELIEEYLCAVFLELRMMANYFRSTDQLFERLSAGTDYDYILRRRSRVLLANSNELFLKLKTSFLSALQTEAHSHNRYIASIFHNVLMLYYLNGNPNYTANQIERLRKKRYHLDTNVLYAQQCPSSQFHRTVIYLLEKINRLGARVTIYERSVREYQNSLKSTYTRYKKDNGVQLSLSDRRPWIWEEYSSDPDAYHQSFEYCVALHQIPKGYTDPGDEWIDVARGQLHEKGIELVEMESWQDHLGLGQLYEDVHKAKRRYNKENQYWEPITEFESYEEQVLHDANCLVNLSCDGSNPLDTRNVFVTCDFRLANVRKKEPGRFPFLVTITEFFEFMMPYLLVADAVGSSPIELPNSLLAGAISQDLASASNYHDSVRRHLTTEVAINQDTVILSRISATERFRRVKKRLGAEPESDADLIEMGTDIAVTMSDYDKVLNGELRKRMFKTETDELKDRITKLEKEKTALEKKLDLQDKKDRKRQKYERKHRRRSNE